MRYIMAKRRIKRDKVAPELTHVNWAKGVVDSASRGRVLCDDGCGSVAASGYEMPSDRNLRHD